MSGPLPPSFMRGADIPMFHTGDIARRAAQMQSAGREIIAMHFGEPNLGAPPAAIRAAHRALDHEPMVYWNSQRLRERIARHYLDEYGVTVSSDRILLTAGASAGLIAVFTALFATGDRVGLLRPGYPAYRHSLSALGRTPVEIDCGPASQYRLTTRILTQVADPLHGLVLASPNNPTGAVVPHDELAALAAACRARGVRLISDEIYHFITYGERCTSALEVDPDTVVVSSFSKLFRMTGWRLGWLVVPADCITRLTAYLVNFFLTPPAIAQHAALGAFEDMALLRQAIPAYAYNRDRLLAELPKLGLARVNAPDGAFYLYADVGHLTSDSLTFCRELLEDTGLALAPGVDFDPEAGRGFVRLSFAIEKAQVERAIEILRNWLPHVGQKSRR